MEHLISTSQFEYMGLVELLVPILWHANKIKRKPSWQK